MAGLSMKNTKQEKNTFRKQVIKKIFSFRTKYPGIFRSTECLAITIGDRFEDTYVQSDTYQELEKIDIELFSLTLLWMACKIHQYSRLKLRIFMKQTSKKEEHEQIRKQFIQTQIKILATIDFDIPRLTAYDLLDIEISPQQFEGDRRRKVLICLKIFMKALELSPKLSLIPELGKQFYRITKTGYGSQNAIKLYQQSRDHILSLIDNTSQ